MQLNFTIDGFLLHANTMREAVSWRGLKATECVLRARVDLLYKKQMEKSNVLPRYVKEHPKVYAIFMRA